MKIIFSQILVLIFSGLSLLHFYWAVGGKFGLDKALPTTTSGKSIMNPSILSTVLVGVVLGCFAAFYLYKSGLYEMKMPNFLILLLGYGIPIIFILRAIGDFKYVGIFKKINDTPFAQMDTYYYVPLCLVIGIVGGIVQLKN